MRKHRRALLRFLAASPLLAAGVHLRAAAADAGITSAADALDVFDLEAVARQKMAPAHWGYLQGGVDGDATIAANREAFARWGLVPRRFVDVSRIDLATTVLGTPMASPVMLSPIGSLLAVGVEGDRGVARAARTRSQTQIFSTQASDSIEAITEQRGAAPWFQLYTTNRPEATRRLLRRAEAAGCSVVVVTVDLPAGRNAVTAARLRRDDTRPCATCHETDFAGNPRQALNLKPMFAGIDTRGLSLVDATLGWDYIRRLRDMTSLKIVIKGIEAAEDALLAVEHGADGIMVSNHGGRALESGRGTLDALPGVVRATAGRVPVLVDGGIRRGTDVYKALALGASAVGVGRPYAWGLAAFGQPGVERVMALLDRELRLAMAGCGARQLSEISATSVVAAN